MHSPKPYSRLAVRLRRLRSHFGIAAPRVTVRSQLPWYWQMARGTVVIAIAIASAGWIYDAGRRIVGIDPDQHQAALAKMRSRVAELESIRQELQTAANSAQSTLQIEHSAQESMRRQVQALETENTRLKEDLAIFENMSQGEEADGTLSISRLRVDAALATGVFTYRLLASQQSEKNTHEFNGQLQLQLTVQQSGKNVMIVLPKDDDAEKRRYSVSFRRFKRLEGTFRLPDGGKLLAVEARLIQDGNTKASARIAL